ncbi:hypothetical protein KFL_010190010 [Klebsormidium nitens]|uniref:Uncharacterized protein n=1 Tax=Klebsormidium nitens TaxID=105231 RepID=A0A1Y1ISF3_KLENI|nr:hypothetical protein KFL_010190010 [Klebsormidium nitens]|eukprot:GAQ92459.1 hypothetical protein KFL_010190010 [Klebsormidium nitens]
MMEHIRAASRRALNAGPSPRMEPGRQLINRFSKIVAAEPDPPPSATPRPVIPPLRTVETVGTVTRVQAEGQGNLFQKGVGFVKAIVPFFQWGLSFEQLLPLFAFTSVIVALCVMYLRKRSRDRRISPFVPIDLPAYSRARDDPFVTTSNKTHSELAAGEALAIGFVEPVTVKRDIMFRSGRLP